MGSARLRGCRAYRGRLDAILDGGASLDSRLQVEAHAESCGACAAELRDALEIRRWIDSSPEPELRGETEDAFVHEVLRRIDGNVAGASPARGWKRTRPRLWRVASLAAVAAAAIVFFALRVERTPELLPPARRDQAVATTSKVELVPLTVEVESVHGVLPDPVPVDRVAFASALRSLLASSLRLAPLQPAFLRPGADLESRLWFAPLTTEFGSDGALRGARAVLLDPAATELAPLAARLLGPRADLRDRRLLIQTLPTTGLAGALALAERGPVGLDLLWDLACSEPAEDDPRQRLAVRALMVVSQAGKDPLPPPLDPTRNVALAADLIVAAGDGAAARLLDLYLKNGAPGWIDAWERTPDRDESLAAVLGGSRRIRAGAGMSRRIVAIERARFAPGLPFVMAALENGDRAAIRALVALPGVDSAVALLHSARAGLLRAEVEDLAWASLAEEQPGAVLDLLLDECGKGGESFSIVITSLALVESSCPSARRILALAGLESGFESGITSEQRTRVLLLAFDGEATFEAMSVFDASIRQRLHELTTSPSAPLAAAAWIGIHWLGDLPLDASSDLMRALTRPATGTVHHLRVVRSIEKARARAATRSL